MSDLGVLLLDAAIFLSILAGLFVVVYGLCRFVGLGRCHRCRRPVPPWNAYCWTHSPLNGGSDE